MALIIDLAGSKFGKLTVLSRSTGFKRVYWDCLCDCGNTSIHRTDALRSGASKSCGCFKVNSTKIYAKDHVFYETWRNMNKRAKKRGISVCFSDVDDAYAYALSIGWCKGLAVCRGTKDNPDQGNYEVGNMYIDTRGNNARDYFYKTKKRKQINS